MHDAEPRVMMESSKNVAVSDLVPCSYVGVEGVFVGPSQPVTFVSSP